jgi:hypothetical protein
MDLKIRESEGEGNCLYFTLLAKMIAPEDRRFLLNKAAFGFSLGWSKTMAKGWFNRRNAGET